MDPLETLKIIGDRTRNPLQVIISGITFIRSELTTEESNVILTQMESSASSMAAIIACTLRETSHSTASSIPVHTSMLDMTAFRESHIRLLTARAREHDYTLDYAFESDIQKVRTEQYRLTAAFESIMRYITGHKPETSRRIHIMGMYDCAELVFTVTAGCSHTAHPGQPVDPEREPELALADSMLREARGSMSLFDLNGKGMAILVRMPGEADGEAPATQPVISRRVSAVSPTTPSILVVDDSAVVRKMTVNILCRAGYSAIHEATNGKEAVERFSEVRPSIVLMDIQMPVMTGDAATRQIRMMDKHVPIAAITGNHENNIQSRMISIGFTDYLCKPVRKDTLLALIDKYKTISTARRLDQL